jgi:lipopolysaccharide core galacturonosyltransferase RgtB
VPQAVIAATLQSVAAPMTRRQTFLWLIAAYVAVQAGLRLATSASLGRDDLIEAIVAQGWALGYNPTQPPLYTWLIVAASDLIGPGVPAHVLVKFASFYFALLFYFLAAERALEDAYLAALATLAWPMTYMFGWDVTQNYTQSVLLMALSAALMYLALRMRDGARWPDYLALGLLLGLGTLTKYGFAIFAGTLFAAALIDPGLRRALFNWRIVFSILLALLLVAPHVLWLKFGPHQLRGAFTGALQVGWKDGYWAGVGAGLVSMLRSSFDFLAPGIVIWAVLFWRAVLPGTAASGAPMRRLFGAWLLLSYAVLTAGVLFAGATAIKYHYMVAVLLPAPIWLMLRVRDRGLESVDRPGWRGQALAAACALCVLAVLTGVAWRGFGAPDHCGRCYLHWDYAAVAQKLRADGFARGTILADDHHVGGNLRTYFPDAPMYSLKFPDFVPPRRTPGNGQCVALWDAAAEGDELPDDITDFLKIRLGGDIDPMPPTRIIELPYRGSTTRMLKLGYVLFPNGTGKCR